MSAFRGFLRNGKFCLTTALFLSQVYANASEIEIGMNYNWWRFTPKSEAECRAHPASPFRGNWALPQYQDVNIRRTVKTQLQEMRQSGFTLLKIMVFHRRPHLSQDSDFFFSEDGSLAVEDRAKLQSFVSDIAAAGFKRLEVAPSPMDENAPFCHRQNWGDCFDPQRTDENWRFISEVTKAVMEKKAGMSVLFDLADEAACPAANMRSSTLLNTKRYVQTIAARWQSQFGDSWVMSCPNSERAIRLHLLLEDLGEAGIRPRYLEIHNYEVASAALDSTLDAVQAMAEHLGAHAIIGEMQYDSVEKSALIADWLKRNPQSRFSAMMMWPLRKPVVGSCQMDAAPPYKPGPLNSINAN